MKKILMLIIPIGLFIISCDVSHNDDVFIPTKPETKEFDLNGDLINDFKIQYVAGSWDGVGPNGTGEFMVGEIYPLNNTKILNKQDQGYLFMPLIDTVHFKMNLPFLWQATSAKLVEIKTYINEWPNEWSVNSNELKDFYYLAFFIPTEDSNIIGWIKIQIDKSSGLIEIKETKSTNQDLLIIGKQ
jgi:hypothetical protein